MVGRYNLNNTLEESPMSLEDIQSREARHYLKVVDRMPLAIVEGKGSRVWDIYGKEYIDLTAGWGVTSIGHSHPALVEAITYQASRLMQTTNLFYTIPQLELAEALLRHTPNLITKLFLVNSGTEAVEAALKFAYRATGRAKFISAENSFHGRTLGALSINGQEKHRQAFAGLLREPCIVPFGDLSEARHAIDENTAAFIVEPIQGEGGVNVAPRNYLRDIAEECRSCGALLILDEIQTGIGRSGRWFAFEHDSVTPDILLLGKGLGGGFPVAGILCTDGVASTISLGDHGGTYIGNPLGAAAALAVLKVIEDEGLVERSALIGAELSEKLSQFSSNHPDLATGTRGRGLLQGLILSDSEVASRIPRQAIERGVLVNVTAGNIVRFFPSLNIPTDDLWTAIETVFSLIRSHT